MNEIQNTEVEQPVTPEVQPEPKVMQQHEINALVAGSKQKGFDKGYQQAKAELMAQLPAQNQASPVQNTGVYATNDERLRQIALEELQKQRAIENANYEAKMREEAGNRILGELNTKAAAAKSKFDDYDKVVHEGFENFAATPEVLLLANQFDNAGEMIYDLGKNPGKIAQISYMYEKGMKQQAFQEMKRLSDSIKVNELSANQPKPKMPLSQITPSNIGVGKIDGNVTSNDFRGSY